MGKPLYAALFAAIGFLLFLLVETVLLRFARKKLVLVIQVNGSRGKSTVTRMIHTLLRSRGMVVFGKTSGSAARLLLPDGTERTIRRPGPANVREQRNMMLRSVFSGAEALVFECSAIKAELQQISARWLDPDITVITNVRPDHTLELGSAADAAAAFAGAIPPNRILVSSDSRFNEIWRNGEKQKDLEYHFVNPVEIGAEIEGEFPENIAAVLGVADCLGINRDEALRAFLPYTRDAGAFALFSWMEGAHGVFFADARAANDIESTGKIVGHTLSAFKEKLKDMQCIMLVINREDRPDRTKSFVQYAAHTMGSDEPCFERCLFMGHAPWYLRRAVKQSGARCGIIRDLSAIDRMISETPRDTLVMAMGNYGGRGRLAGAWLETKKKKTDFRKITGACF
ncbi:hypothetical protein AGMMS49579_06060 [Spirochaetia bacterium]|nr:hypothetical protein AGMMS49579_06060 [Spirochaetia bacterium]